MMHQADLNTLRSDTASELSALRSLQRDTYRDMEILKERIESLKTQVAAQNERIRDNDADIARFSIIAATLGTLITIVVGGVTIAGVYGAGDRADASVRNWIKEEGGKVLKEEGGKTIKELTGPDSDFRKQLGNSAEIARLAGEKIRADGEKFQEDARVLLAGIGDLGKKAPSAETQAKLATLAAEIDQKSNKQKTSVDWMTTAFDAYYTGKKEDAIKHWDKAIAIPDTKSTDIAMALFNKGVALGELKRHDDEIRVYDEVIRRFGDASEPALREWVAMALVNKGVPLGELKRHDDAIRAYDEVIRRFGDASEPALREQLAKAMVYKGFALGELKRHDDAIRTYDEVIRRFGDASEPPLRDLVALAQRYKTITLKVKPPSTP